MDYLWLDQYLLQLPGAASRWHPAWRMTLFEVRGKQFAARCTPEERYKTYGGRPLVNLRCDQRLIPGLREKFPELLPGFYTGREGWIAAMLDGELPGRVLRDLCLLSYRLTVEKLPKYVQRELGRSASGPLGNFIGGDHSIVFLPSTPEDLNSPPAEAKNKKFLYLPTARSGPSERAEAPPEGFPGDPTGKYPCPCCGSLTFPVPREEAMAFICPVCFWENDVFDPGEDAPSDENRGMTLRQGRENYRKWGAVREDLVQYTRPPRPEELPK